MACREKPTCRGSVTATICMTPGVEQPLDALADGGLGEPDRGGDPRVGTPAVLLQLLDDRPRDVVEHQPAGPG